MCRSTPRTRASGSSFMIEDARVTVLLTRERLRRDGCPHCAATAVVSNRRGLAPRRARGAENRRGDSADNLAYVIYTSGSTGQTEGRLIPHRAITRLVLRQRLRRLDAEDSVAQASNASLRRRHRSRSGARSCDGARLVVLQHGSSLRLRRTSRAVLRRAEGHRAVPDHGALQPDRARDAAGASARCGTSLFGGEAVRPGARARSPRARRARRACSTSTARPKARPSRPGHRRSDVPTRRDHAAHRPAPRQHAAFILDRALRARARSASPASSTSAATGWRAATSSRRR